MAKKSDFPVYLRDFATIMQSYNGKYHDYTIFSDFIDYTIGVLMCTLDKETAIRLSKYYGQDCEIFGRLFESYKKIFLQRTGETGGWADPLGHIYETIASQSKKSGFGQFFTPEPICDLMAKMTITLSDKKGQKINDPACGSGRMLLAANGGNGY